MSLTLNLLFTLCDKSHIWWSFQWVSVCVCVCVRAHARDAHNISTLSAVNGLQHASLHWDNGLRRKRFSPSWNFQWSRPTLPACRWPTTAVFDYDGTSLGQTNPRGPETLPSLVRSQWRQGCQSSAAPVWSKELVSWCFEPSQPLWITSELKNKLQFIS